MNDKKNNNDLPTGTIRPNAAAETIDPAPPVSRDTPTHIKKGSKGFLHTILALFCGGFVTFALLYCVQPMMPVFSEAFGINAAESSMVLSVSTAMLAIGLLITGPISDAFGRKRIMVLALLSAGVFTIASALMPTWHGVLAMRALVGLSLSGMAAVAMTYLSEEIHPMHIGLAIGLLIGGNALGGMGGRLINGVLVDFVSWHTALGILGGLSLLATLVFWRSLPDSKHFQPTSLHLNTLLDGYRMHFRDAGLPWLFLCAFLLMGSFVTLFNYLAYRLLASPYSVSQSVVGLLSLVYLIGIYSSTWAGSMADRLGRRTMFWCMIATMFSGLLVTQLTSIWLVFAGVMIFTFGFFGAHSIASSWVGSRAKKAKGQASSLYLFCYYTGSSVAGTGGGYFWQHYGWTGTSLFIGMLILVALGAAIHLARVPSIR